MPIFSAGVRDGVYYSVKDLDAIVANHQLTNSTWMPAAGLGHYGDGASLLGDMERTQTKPLVSFKRIPLIWPNLNKLGCTGTAEPAVGWITKLWRVGSTLFAKLEDIPAIVAQMIKDKMFRFVSAEIYQRPPDGIPGEGCFLHGIGFLGKTPPEVKTLGEVPEPQLQTFSSNHVGKQVPVSIVSQLPRLRLQVFSEVKPMDLNQLATDLKLSPDAVKALGTLAPADQDALKLALEKGKTAEQVAVAPPAANADVAAEVAAMTREEVLAKLAEFGQASEEFGAMTDDELKQLLSAVITGETEAFDDIQVPPEISSMTRESLIAELVGLGEDATTLGDLTDDDLKRLLAELKQPAANSEGSEEDDEEEPAANSQAAGGATAKAHSQAQAHGKTKAKSQKNTDRPQLRVFSEQEFEEVVNRKVQTALNSVSGKLKEIEATSRREAALQRRREIKMREARINAFCERGIKERKIMPYELDENRKDAQGRPIPSLRSILRDAANQAVAFSEGGKTVRTTLAAQIMRYINNRKPVVFSEIIPGGANDAAGRMSPERRRELLGYTGIGQQILKSEASKN